MADNYSKETVKVLVGIAYVVGMIMAKAELQDANEVEANVGRIVSSPLVGPDVFEGFVAEAARILVRAADVLLTSILVPPDSRFGHPGFRLHRSLVRAKFINQNFGSARNR